MRNLNIRFESTTKDRKPKRELDEWIAEFVFYEPKPDYLGNMSLALSSSGEYSKKKQWYFMRHTKEWTARYYSANIDEAFAALDKITDNCFQGSIHLLDKHFIRCDIWAHVRTPELEKVASAEVYDNPAMAICLAIKDAILWDKRRVDNLHK